MASNSLLAIYTLAQRELVGFLRQRNRVFGALAQPVLFWLLLGSGFSASFVPGGSKMSYVEYFFPGTVVLIILFTAIFSTISIIDDRNAGFMQSVLVAPVSTAALVLGKLAGTTALATIQALAILVLAPIAGIHLSVAMVLLAIPLIALISFGLAGLGLAIAWRMDSTQGFHAIMMAFLMPMWFLSGAFFPAQGTPGWLWLVIAVNPLTYGVAALRDLLYLGVESPLGGLPHTLLSLVIVTAFAAAMLYACIRVARNRSAGVGG